MESTVEVPVNCQIHLSARNCQLERRQGNINRAHSEGILMCWC